LNFRAVQKSIRFNGNRCSAVREGVPNPFLKRRSPGRDATTHDVVVKSLEAEESANRPEGGGADGNYI
jgi:hypothetical protein